MRDSYFPPLPEPPSDTWAPAAYFSLACIAMFTVILIIFEIYRTRTLSLLNKGYYFVEEFVTTRQKSLIPVPPENVDLKPEPSFDEWAPAAYFGLVCIAMFTFILVMFEIFIRRKTLTLLNKGYYFTEVFVTLQRKSLIPVPPENVDLSNPENPRVINPALLQSYNCCSY